jgi:hypothetical protein
MMSIYSVLLILLNRRLLPEPIRMPPSRALALAWSAAAFGLLAALTIAEQLRLLLA